MQFSQLSAPVQDQANTYHNHDFTEGRVSSVLPLRYVLTQLCDITSPPRRPVLKFLSGLAKDRDEAAKLAFLASTSQLAAGDYSRWVANSRLTLAEILRAFTSIPSGCMSPLELVGLLPPLQPRFYSIASSPLLFPHSVHMTTVLLRYTSAAGYAHKGVCTGYLAEQQPGSRIPIFVKPSAFRLPNDPNTPIIMIGAGTGVAPFRAFLQHRLYDTSNRGPGLKELLFFGFDYIDRDWIYREELEQFVERGKGSVVIENAIAFDRPWRVFVQYRMVEPQNAERIWDIVHNQGGHVYLCGDSQGMAGGAHEALLQIAMEKGGMNRNNAEFYWKDRLLDRRYQKDVF